MNLNKTAAISCILILVGAERIMEWYFYGYAKQHGPSMPEAVGTHARVTGVVIVALGVWAAFASTRGKFSRSTSSATREESPGPTHAP